MSPINIAAIADVHCPRYLSEFKTALSKSHKPDIFLFAGDMVNRGTTTEYINVLDAVESQFGSDFPIVACYGNEDPVELQDELQVLTKGRITFLDEKSITLNLSGSKVAIIGMSAASMEPSEPQGDMVSDIQSVFEERASHLSRLLEDAVMSSDYVVLLMHYCPLLESTSDEFSWWMSRALETSPPNLIVHGHIHNSTRNKIEIGTTTIRNVALPAIGSITELSL